MKQGDIWYVTFGPDKTDETAESMSRSTRTFKSEVDAKLFAMQILSKGWTASAGTLNPHQPKQVVGPAQIEQLGRSGGWAGSNRCAPSPACGGGLGWGCRGETRPVRVEIAPSPRSLSATACK